jgi:hypothetical protein
MLKFRVLTFRGKCLAAGTSIHMYGMFELSENRYTGTRHSQQCCTNYLLGSLICSPGPARW